MFELNSFEVLLSFLTILSCGAIIIYYYRSLKEIESVFCTIVSICFAIQLLYVLKNISSDGNGYGCLGLSSGALGLLYSSFVVVMLYSKDTNPLIRKGLIVISVIGILLTGSRTAMLLLFLFAARYVIVDLPAGSGKKWLLIGAGIVALIVLTAAQTVISLYSNKIYSLINLLHGNVLENLVGDKSIRERILSWQCAFEIIAQNPLGISCSAKDLMERMLALGATTFPHSYLLCYYCLFGVGGLIIYIGFIRQRMLSKNNKTMKPISTFMILVLTLYGGISTEYLLFFWFFLLYAYMKTGNTVERNPIS